MIAHIESLYASAERQMEAFQEAMTLSPYGRARVSEHATMLWGSDLALAVFGAMSHVDGGLRLYVSVLPSSVRCSCLLSWLSRAQQLVDGGCSIYVCTFRKQIMYGARKSVASRFLQVVYLTHCSLEPKPGTPQDPSLSRAAELLAHASSPPFSPPPNPPPTPFATFT